MNIRLKVPYWRQDKKENACGPICIRMVLSYLQKRRLTKSEYDKILELTIDVWNGTTERGMISSVRKHGYKCHIIHGINGLDKALNRNHPVIVKCRMNDQKCLHYIVITGRSDNEGNDYLYLNDPYEQKKGRIEASRFMKNGNRLNWGNKKWGMEIF